MNGKFCKTFDDADFCDVDDCILCNKKNNVLVIIAAIIKKKNWETCSYTELQHTAFHEKPKHVEFVEFYYDACLIPKS